MADQELPRTSNGGKEVPGEQVPILHGVVCGQADPRGGDEVGQTAIHEDGDAELRPQPTARKVENSVNQ
jgi:hypothetical protein